METDKTVSLIQKGTEIGGLPVDVLEYVIKHYPEKDLTAELFRKAEAELREQKAEEWLSSFAKEHGIEIRIYRDGIMSALIIETRKGSRRIKKAITPDVIALHGFGTELRFIIECMADEIDREEKQNG